MKPKVTTFIFDCFKVFFTPPLTLWFEKNVVNRNGEDIKFKELIRKSDLGIIDGNELLDYVKEFYAPNKTRDELRKGIHDLGILNDELVCIVEKLKQKGYKIALLSNGHHDFFEQRAYPAFPEFKKLFDVIVISSLVQMIKPDPKIYEYTLREINSLPEDSIFVDDNVINVKAAESLGINGFLYTDVKSFLEYLDKIGIDIN